MKTCFCDIMAMNLLKLRLYGVPKQNGVNSQEWLQQLFPFEIISWLVSVVCSEFLTWNKRCLWKLSKFWSKFGVFDMSVGHLTDWLAWLSNSAKRTSNELPFHLDEVRCDHPSVLFGTTLHLFKEDKSSKTRSFSRQFHTNCLGRNNYVEENQLRLIPVQGRYGNGQLSVFVLENPQPRLSKTN